MPRGLRNLPADMLVHVVNRGNDKRLLFPRADDYEDFLRMVVWAKAQCAVRILAYCVMANHWHFVFWVASSVGVAISPESPSSSAWVAPTGLLPSGP